MQLFIVLRYTIHDGRLEVFRERNKVTSWKYGYGYNPWRSIHIKCFQGCAKLNTRSLDSHHSDYFSIRCTYRRLNSEILSTWDTVRMKTVLHKQNCFHIPILVFYVLADGANTAG